MLSFLVFDIIIVVVDIIQGLFWSLFIFLMDVLCSFYSILCFDIIFYVSA